MPNDRIDEIYKLMMKQKDDFFNYVQQDNTDKNNIKRALQEGQATVNETLTDIKSEVSQIKDQAKIANGRTSKLELVVTDLQNKNEKRIIVSRVNWKWVSAIGSVIAFAWTVASVFVYKWLEKKFFN